MTQKTIYNKLVRDNIPDIIADKGEECEFRIMKNTEYKKELFKKFIEEIEEFKKAKPEEKIEELADILEILKTITVSYGLNLKEIQKVQAEKQKKRGGFSKKIFLKWSTTPTNSQK
jgi:predicted house-cleaning noncanonical NTP pyrophosphatase (MazG superfamily)